MPYDANSRSIKVDTNEAIVAYHVIDGPVTFQYKADARSAVARHPLEWSMHPWDRDGAKRGREHVIERHKRETAEAEERARRKEIGAPAPLDFPEEEELTAEEQAAIDEHARAVAEANERLKAFHEKKAAEKAEADQVAADEALVRSPPPRPEPVIRRPFGRKGEPTPAEIEQHRKREAKRAADEEMVRAKAEEDRIAAAEAGGARLTT